MAHDVVSIHIDNKEYKSPNPTTGAALYVLGHIDPNLYDLFRETHGHGDDEPILNCAVVYDGICNTNQH